MNNTHRTILFFTLLLALCVRAAHAQSSGGNYQMTQSVIAGGGGSSQDASTVLKLDATIGEPLAGLTGGGTFSLYAGFRADTAPAATCVYAVNPLSQNFTAPGGANSIGVTTTGGNCMWTAISNNPEFITVTAGASGMGNGTVSYSVAANSNTTSRTGTINVAGQLFTVTQDGATPTSTPTPTPTPTVQSQLQFSAANFSTNESAASATITVTRTGDTSGIVSVDYKTVDDFTYRLCGIAAGSADQRCDYTTTVGTLTFNAGETTKTFVVPLIDDAYTEGAETIPLALSNPMNGASLAAQSTALLTINDNDAGAPTANPIDNASFFVRQQYYDFLNRLPDDGGLAYWTSLITSCNGDAACINRQRITVSAAFFIEQEFQLTGNYVYRMYKAAYGERPVYTQFLPDRARINPEQSQLEASKQQFADLFVRRAEFTQRFPATLSGEQFIDALIASIQQKSGVDLSGQRAALINDYATYGSRARIVRLLAENQAFKDAEYNKAFVLMQYFGYLRRDPDQGGYDFWLSILNDRVPGNFRSMVCAFINSREYQERFSSVVTRTDSVCGQ